MRFSSIARWCMPLAFLLPVSPSHTQEDLPAEEKILEEPFGEETLRRLGGVADPVEETGEPKAGDGTDNTAGEDTPSDEETCPWISSLEAGQRQAQAAGKPVLVRVAADWCLSCRALAKAVRKKELQQELAGWVLVHIDVTAGPTDIKELQIEAVPTLIVRTAGGHHRQGRTETRSLAFHRYCPHRRRVGRRSMAKDTQRSCPPADTRHQSGPRIRQRRSGAASDAVVVPPGQSGRSHGRLEAVDAGRKQEVGTLQPQDRSLRDERSGRQASA